MVQGSSRTKPCARHFSLFDFALFVFVNIVFGDFSLSIISIKADKNRSSNHAALTCSLSGFIQLSVRFHLNFIPSSFFKNVTSSLPSYVLETCHSQSRVVVKLKLSKIGIYLQKNKSVAVDNFITCENLMSTNYYRDTRRRRSRRVVRSCHCFL